MKTVLLTHDSEEIIGLPDVDQERAGPAGCDAWARKALDMSGRERPLDGFLADGGKI